MIIEKIYFNATDYLELFGLLHRNKEQISDTVVLSIHGMTSNCLKKRENIFAEEWTSNNIDYFCFNNRGCNISQYFEKVKNGKIISRIESGSAFEKFEDCYYDIKGAILYLLNKGYKNIYLQGHSLGASKVVYTYNKLKENQELNILEHINLVILLSLVDIPRLYKYLLGDRYVDAINEAKDLVNKNLGKNLIKRENFLHPISAENFLKYSEIGGCVDLAEFGKENAKFEKLKNIDSNLIMVWGKNKDMIIQTPEELERILRSNIPNINVEFIEETGHNYHLKEKDVVKNIIKYLLFM